MRAQPIRTVAIVVALLGTACTTTPPLGHHDVEAYLRLLSHWAPQEAEVARAVGRILETQFVDEAEVRRQITESLPRLDAQLAVMTAYHGHAAQIESIHRQYLEAWQRLRRGYDEIIAGLDKGDQAALGRGRQAMIAWRLAIPRTAERVRELADATDVATKRGPPT